MAEDYLAQSRDIANILNTSTDPQVFFQQYEKLVEVLKKLVAVSHGVDYEGEHPKVLLKRVNGEEQRANSRNALILRCFQMAVSDMQRANSIEEREEIAESFRVAFSSCRENFTAKEKQKIEKSHTLLLETYVIPVQKARRERLHAQEVQRRKEKETQKEQDRKMKERRASYQIVAQEAISRNLQFQQEQKKSQEHYRRERKKITSGWSYGELLRDSIRFASTQFYITPQEMEQEYPSLSPTERSQLLSDLEQRRIIQARPGSDSWLSLVDSQMAEDLAMELITVKNVLGFETERSKVLEIDKMGGHEFEHFCAGLLRKNGFTDVQVTQASGDFGIDILAQKDGVSYGIQCKCYSDAVGNHAVQEALSGAQYYHRMVAVVMTNNYFTQAAIETAQRTNVLLWNRDKVLEMASSGNG